MLFVVPLSQVDIAFKGDKHSKNSANFCLIKSRQHS